MALRHRRCLFSVVIGGKADMATRPGNVVAPQRRPKDERYLLQVDRQTKASSNAMDSAENAGAAIKKLYPVVKVTIYDAESNATKVIG